MNLNNLHEFHVIHKKKLFLFWGSTFKSLLLKDLEINDVPLLRADFNKNLQSFVISGSGFNERGMWIFNS